MAHSTSRPISHSTTNSAQGTWSTKRIALCALFVAVAMVASFIELPIFPPAPWLKYDPSGVVCLVAGLAFGPSTGALVSVLSWLPHLIMNPWGGLMGILCALALTLPAALIYQHNQTRNGAIVGMVVGALVTLAVAIVANIIVTPLYAGVTTADVIAMVVPILLPFNVIKVALNCVITLIAYKSISKLVGE